MTHLKERRSLRATVMATGPLLCLQFSASSCVFHWYGNFIIDRVVCLVVPPKGCLSRSRLFCSVTFPAHNHATCRSSYAYVMIQPSVGRGPCSTFDSEHPRAEIPRCGRRFRKCSRDCNHYSTGTVSTDNHTRTSTSTSSGAGSSTPSHSYSRVRSFGPCRQPQQIAYAEDEYPFLSSQVASGIHGHLW